MVATRKLTTGTVVPGTPWIDYVDAEIDGVWLNTINRLTGTAGTSTAYTASATPPFLPGTLAFGTVVIFVPHVTNGPGPTLNVNGIGAYTLRKADGTVDGAAVAAGELVANYPYMFEARDSSFVLLGGSVTTPSAPWTPLDLGSSLICWWDAEDFATIALDSDPLYPDDVIGWADKVTGFTPDQTNPHIPGPPVSNPRPVYSATAFNGRPGLIFDGENSHLSTDLAEMGPMPAGALPCEIWALADQTDPNVVLVPAYPSRCVFSYGNGTVNGRRLYRYMNGAGATATNRLRATVGTGAASVDVTNLTVDLSGRVIMRGRFEAASVSVSVNGGTMTTAGVAPPMNTVLPFRCRIGSNDGAGSGVRWKGVISLILVTGLLTPDEATSMRDWMAERL